MKTLFVGDVHGCADELRALLERHRPEQVVLVGDLFTKGPDPAGVWRVVEETGARSVLGNHDARLLRAMDGFEDKHAAKVIAQLDKTGSAWRSWLRELPLFLEVGEWTVVHAGVHPSGNLDETCREMAISMRQWPPDDKKNPRWWFNYVGERKIVFGHDAIRGLIRVERHGEPLVIGLDSGCVYGGSLTGYVPDEDRFVSEEAHAVYVDVGRKLKRRAR